MRGPCAARLAGHGDQVYLTRTERDFLRTEANRRGQTMAALLRSLVDERMRIPEEKWANNPLLQPPADDPDYVPGGDAVRHHDHYIYGGPKKYRKIKGKWTLLGPME